MVWEDRMGGKIIVNILDLFILSHELWQLLRICYFCHDNLGPICPVSRNTRLYVGGYEEKDAFYGYRWFEVAVEIHSIFSLFLVFLVLWTLLFVFDGGVGTMLDHFQSQVIYFAGETYCGVKNYFYV